MKMKKMSTLGWIAMILVIVGGLNWGLVGAFKFDLVATIFGTMTALSRIVYILVGLSALYMLMNAFSMDAKSE
jgi:uncharacterized protein